MKPSSLSAMNSGSSYKDSYQGTQSRDESLKICVVDNKKAYQRKASEIDLVIETINRLLHGPSSETKRWIQYMKEITFVASLWKEFGMNWGSEPEAYKFLKSKPAYFDPKTQELNPTEVVKGIEHLTSKAKLCLTVAKLFNTIYAAPEFQTTPMKYIKKWTQSIDEKKLDQEYKKVFKRLNSIKPSGDFSTPDRFRIKSKEKKEVPPKLLSEASTAACQMPIDKTNRNTFLESHLHRLIATHETQMQIGSTEDNGDCLFDSAAQCLSQLMQQNITKKEVRIKIADYLNSKERTWALEKLKPTISTDGNIEDIQFTFEDLNSDSAKIVWGNDVHLEMIATIYHVGIKCYEVTLLEDNSPLDMLSSIEQGESEDNWLKLISKDDKENTSISCDHLYKEEKVFFPVFENSLPDERKKEVLGTFVIANRTRGLNGHFVPVLKRDYNTLGRLLERV